MADQANTTPGAFMRQSLFSAAAVVPTAAAAGTPVSEPHPRTLGSKMRDEDAPEGANSDMSPNMVQALDVISLLRDTGLAVLEAEPNDDMVAAGMAASGLSDERVRTIYKAMLAANNGIADGPQ